MARAPAALTGSARGLEGLVAACCSSASPCEAAPPPPSFPPLHRRSDPARSVLLQRPSPALRPPLPCHDHTLVFRIDFRAGGIHRFPDLFLIRSIFFSNQHALSSGRVKRKDKAREEEEDTLLACCKSSFIAASSGSGQPRSVVIFLFVLRKQMEMASWMLPPCSYFMVTISSRLESAGLVL